MTEPAHSRNHLSGTVGANAVQARSISGGVHFHAGPQAATVIPVPCQLPPQPPHFTDRADVLAAISGSSAPAGPGTVAIMVISGAGGTGKTAVAVHALRQLAARFPGGQLYAVLGGFSPGGPSEPGAVLGRWLRALGVHPSVLPADPEEAAALFRSLTTQNPVAILADDAADARQVRAILPGAGLVVVTSRHQLASLIALDGARFIPLGPLQPGAAAELAAKVTGRQAPAGDFTELARCCGHLPLAIRAAAARLALRPHLDVGQVTRELTAAQVSLHAFEIPSQEGIVTTAMQASYDDLDPDAARAYRLLSLHPGQDFTASAAAALLDAGDGQAGHMITVLAAASLLEETSPGRWRFHDLIRAHARQMTAARDSDDERAAATGRVIDYYLRASAAADLLILPGRLRIAAAFGLPVRCPPAHADTAAALAWLDAELANLLAAQETAADQHRHPAVWQFADTLWGWCSHRQAYQAWQALCERAIASARACGDARAEVFTSVRLASCHIARGDIEAAAPIAATAITTAWVNGDRAGEGSAREHAAICALATGDYHGAIAHCQRGLDCWRRTTEHRRAEALLLRLLGRAYARLGDYPQADAHLDAALSIFRELGEQQHTARTMYVIASTRLDAARPEDAISLLRQAWPLMEADDHPLHLSELLTSLADAHSHAGDISQARDCLHQVTALHQRLDLPASHPACVRASVIARQIDVPDNPRTGGTGPGTLQA